MDYGILTFMLTFFALLITFIYDFYKNLEFRNATFYLVHEDVLSTSLIIESDFSEKYPTFYGVVKTFEQKKFREIFSNLDLIQEVHSGELDSLKEDMKKVVESGSERDKLILQWYFVTCSVVKEVKYSSNKVFKEEIINREFREEGRKMAELPDVVELDLGVCYG